MTTKPRLHRDSEALRNADITLIAIFPALFAGRFREISAQDTSSSLAAAPLVPVWAMTFTSRRRKADIWKLPDAGIAGHMPVPMLPPRRPSGVSKTTW